MTSSSSPPGGTGSGTVLTWQERRNDMPHIFRMDDTFTDIVLVARDNNGGNISAEDEGPSAVGDIKFSAHRLVLACHSEYFLHLLGSGMREAEEGVVRFGAPVDADVLRRVLHYMYTGEVEDVNAMSFEETRALLLTANMWQMSDLESAVLQKVAARCTAERSLKMFLFVREAEETLFSHKSDSVASSVRRDVESVLVKTVRERWHIIVSPANALDDDDYSTSLTDLDLPSLKAVLSIKSDQEEIGDYSFSFNQTDLALAVCQWIKADLASRHAHLVELSSFFCFHQLNSAAKASVSATCLAASSLCSVHPVPSFATDPDSACRGYWCPHRKILGLLVIHAWSPHISNRITLDHIFYYFSIPKALLPSAASEQSSSRPLHSDFFYDVGQFGELGDGEKHLLQSNSCVYLPSADAYMLLTYDGGTLSGTMVDPVGSRYQCPRHHSQMYRFCPSTVAECACEYQQTLVCVSSEEEDEEEGDRVNVVCCPACHKSSDWDGDEISFDPHCDTFRTIRAPPLPLAKTTTGNGGGGEQPASVFCGGRASVAARVKSHEKSCVIFALGGYNLVQGGNFSYVHCKYDLQDFGDGGAGAAAPAGAGGGDAGGGTTNDYKSGHSHLQTSLGYLADTPTPNLCVHAFSPASGEWSESSAMQLPRAMGDAAAVFFKGELWTIGGYEVKYDQDLQLFYQAPLRDTWIYSFEREEWRRGPFLPPINVDGEGEGGGGGVCRGTAHVHEGRLFFSGGARLIVNPESESNQIYEYVPNPRVFLLSGDDATASGASSSARWEVPMDLSYFSSKFRHADYSLLAVVPAYVTLTRLKVRREPNVGSKFLVKYLNINLPLGRGGQ